MTQLPQIKQIWKDSHRPSSNRYIQVLQAANEKGLVKIQTCFASLSASYMPVEVKDGQVSWAREDRFDGTSDGYSFSAQSIQEFRRNKIHMIDFGQQLAKKPKVDIGEGLVGEYWQEICGKHSRIIEIVANLANNKKQIITRYFTAIMGQVPVEIVAAKPTAASSSRFNGKSGGYRFLAKNTAMLIASGALKKTFVPLNDTYIIDRVLATNGVTVQKDQLWQDLDSPRVRLVTIIKLDDQKVELRCHYLGATETEMPVRVSWAKSEIVDLEVFAGERFSLVKTA